LLLSQRMTASRAAVTVGYESVSQFTREYTRMFGVPPARHRRSVEENAVCSKASASVRNELESRSGSIERSRHRAVALAAS
jgi:AraC-like DNA-binding protein